MTVALAALAAFGATALVSLGLGLRWVARRSEERGALKALEEEGERIADAEEELAKRLYDDSALDSHFRVRDPGAWGGPGEGSSPEARDGLRLVGGEDRDSGRR